MSAQAFSIRVAASVNDGKVSEKLHGFICELGDTVLNPESFLDMRSFLQLLQQYFCMVSAGAGKLYEHYELCLSPQRSQTLVAIPSTDFDRPALPGVFGDSVESLNAYVMDGALVGLKGLALAIQDGHEFLTLPLEDGLQWLQTVCGKGGSFLPVLSTRHLQTQQCLTMVRLSQLNPERLDAQCQGSLRDAIERKLEVQSVQSRQAA